MVVLGEVQEVVMHVKLHQLGLAEGIRVGRTQRSRQKVRHLQQTAAARQAQGCSLFDTCKVPCRGAGRKINGHSEPNREALCAVSLCNRHTVAGG